MKVLKKIHEKYTSGYQKWTEYDEFEHETSMNDSTGYWQKTKYNERGYRIHRCDSCGFDESTSYDNQGNIIQVKKGKLITGRYAHDEQGNLLRSEYYNERNGKLKYWNEHKYDDRGNEIYSINENGFEIHYEYNENNLLIHFWDNDGEEIWWHYDQKGFLFHEIYCDGRESWYKHDSNGREIYSKLYSGKETWTEYDDERHIVIKKYQIGSIEKGTKIYENEKITYCKCERASFLEEDWYDYDKNGEFECDKQGNRLHTKSITEIERWWKYNEHGKLIYYKDSSGEEYTNIYDGEEHKIILENKQGNRQIEEYDDDWDLIYRKDWNGNECWQEYYDKQKEND